MSTQETSIPGVDMTVNHAYNAYAARGQITDGSIIYANRCLPKDFAHLDAINVRAWDRVLLCRYGPVQSPGEALEAATNVGARGVIFFLDPADVTNGGPSFPQSWWMPGDAIRRSHVRQDEDIGDPMTPGYASRKVLKTLYNVPWNATRIPKILAQPIGYDDAKKVMGRMKGMECPDDWKIGLGHCSIGETTEDRVMMEIFNTLPRKKIENVVGYLLGTVEADRYVMFGVPLDGWSNGAVAPGSALAQSLELCRLLAALTKTGWKPRRTIVFAGWDAHEFGEVGVTEFIEGNRHKVSSRTVAYLNSDICSSGSEFAVTASPVYRSSFIKATHLVPDFRNSSVTYYKAWSADVNSQKDESGKPNLPPLRKRGSFLPFVHYAGVPSLDVGFRNNLSKSLYFPAYGTALDTLVLAEKFVDPGFKVHRMCTQLLATLIRMWSDTPLLPYDLTELKGQLNSQFGAMKKTYEATIKKSNISFVPWT
ncbi:aminopeptidase NAALADL1-like isoform X2 [Ixodes scapularis]|uniref:aminopeptidase NAALADL1-like isoform X2 n=1 Tax=Ixodes scapularis TaxID=6945 RepID=UPI001AD78AF7|nr:aminopeptidase NAALADL1-like isoform X2 [Ixodes scapularis]